MAAFDDIKNKKLSRKAAAELRRRALIRYGQPVAAEPEPDGDTDAADEAALATADEAALAAAWGPGIKARRADDPVWSEIQASINFYASRGMTQTEWCQMTGITRQTLHNLKYDRSPFQEARRKAKVARAKAEVSRAKAELSSAQNA